MTILTQGNQIVGGIASYFSALLMVDVQFHRLFIRGMRSAALAGVVVSEEYILSYIVLVVHFAVLVVFTLRQRFTFFHGFQTLEIELRGLYAYKAYRQDLTYELDQLVVIVDLYLYGWRKPSFL